MRPTTLALIAILFFAPLAYFGELTPWGFDEPVSNLEWDEAGVRPQQSGGDGGTSDGSSGGDGGGSGSDADSGSGSDPGGSSGSSSERESSSGGADGGSGSGGSGGGGFSFFAGLGTFAMTFGACWLFFGHGMAAFMAAFAQAMMWWAWALVGAIIALMYYYLGIFGGLLVGGGLVTMVILHQKGLIFAAAKP